MVSFGCSQGIAISLLMYNLRTADWSKGTHKDDEARILE